MDVGKRILSDPVNKLVFEQKKRDIYLVGGYMRDILRGKISRDKDFVLRSNADKIARKTAKKFNGTFIELQKNQTYRVVLEGKRTVDFTYLTDGILDNLYERDFTINAIAWSPGTGIVAPPDHLDDLSKRIIKVIRHENLLNDPLRILRAYRLSAQLKFEIDSNTRKYIRKYADKLDKSAPERITEELFKILNNDNSSTYLILSSIDKVISVILPVSSYILKLNIHSIAKFDNFIGKIKELHNIRKLQSYLDSEFSQGLKRSGLIRFYLLTRIIDNQSNYYFKNEAYIHKEIKFLEVSNKIRKSLQNLFSAELAASGRISEKKLFEIFKRAGGNVYEIALIISLSKNDRYLRFLNRAVEFLKIKNKDLLSGYEIKKILNIPPGAIFGEIKDSIKERHFLGHIKNKKEARAWILSNFT